MKIVYGPSIVEWVAKMTSEYGSFGAATGIGVEREGKIIAGVVYNEWNGVNCNMHVAAVPRSNWLTRNGLWYWFDYPFNQLKVNRVTALIDVANEDAIRLNEGVGFIYETRISKAAPGGDMLVYRMFREDCKWLNLKRPQDERKAA